MLQLNSLPLTVTPQISMSLPALATQLHATLGSYSKVGRDTLGSLLQVGVFVLMN